MDAVENVLPDISTPSNKHPGFDGLNYTFWRFKMEKFIKAHGYRLWNIIQNGNLVPKDSEGTPKAEDKFTDDDFAMMELNHKAIHMIQCALSQKESFRISHLKSAKEMWDALQTAHEGTTGVKDRRVEMLVEEFHKFTILSDEPIGDLEIRFTHLINNLATLGRTIC